MVTSVVALLASGVAHADETWIRAQDPQSLVTALTAAGMEASLGNDTLGDPLISASTHGTNFSIYFYDCTNNAECRSFQFSSGYKLDKKFKVQDVNAWNIGMRWGRAYLKEKDTVFVELDVDSADSGITGSLFTDLLDRWVQTLQAFEGHIGYGS